MQIPKPLLAVFIALLSLLYPVLSVAATKYTSVESLLKDQTTIRIIADGADGFGDQAASVNLIIRLRQMGYQGAFEFIYPDSGTEKIATLFDLPKDIPDVYQDEKRNIRFIKFKNYITEYNNKTAETVTLGMAGAYSGNVCKEAEHDGADIHNIDVDTCNNFSKIFNSKVFIRFSSFTYAPEDRTTPTKFDTIIEIPGQTTPYYQIGSDSTFITMPVANLAETKTYLANDTRGQDLLLKKPALKALIDAMENPSINVMPAYGYSLQIRGICGDSYNNESDCLFAKLGNMLQVLSSARHTQLHGSFQFRKPLVIPVFYNYEKEAEGLTQLIDGKLWKSITLPEAKQAAQVIERLHLRHNFFTANADDPAAIQQIKKLKCGQILLLSVGPLPKIVFDGIYTYTGSNIWPQIREGASSFNSLILTGRPHFRCGGGDGWEIGFDLVKEAKLKNQLKNLYDYRYGICQQNAWQTTSTSINNLSQLIIDANNPHSALSKYFTQLKAIALKPENDRIQSALLEAINLLDE